MKNCPRRPKRYREAGTLFEIESTTRKIISLLLPKFDMEGTIGEAMLYKPCLPC
jgi:hypothetical protein